jgi:hypothetical protein
MQTNEVTKEISLNKLNLITDNIPTAKNWSSKLDPSKKISVKYQVGSYAQENNLNYQSDELLIKYFGRGSIDVTNVNLPKTKELITLNGTAADSTLKVQNRTTPLLPFRDTITSAFVDKNIRYLILDEDVTAVTLNTTDVIPILPLAYFQKTGKSDSLDFPSLITANYGTLQGMLDKTKVVSAYFRLTEIDVVNIDFTIPIYLDINTGTTSINGYFYINKISNFKVDSSTLCELIRL